MSHAGFPKSAEAASTQSDSVPETARAHSPDVAADRLEGARVILVDDDVSLCRAISRILRHLGCSVESFSSFADFLVHDDIALADCFLLDLIMPEMSGLELQQKIRERGIDVPVVFLSGKGDIPSTVRAMQNGALDFLEKPVELETLRKAIGAALSRRMSNDSERERLLLTRRRFDSLTLRQREVFGSVVAGEPNKVIAYRMGITIRTVKAHRKEVTDKLEARSVAELAFVARDLGL